MVTLILPRQGLQHTPGPLWTLLGLLFLSYRASSWAPWLAPAFAWLRHSLGLAEEDYQAALGPGGPYLQFLSTSKSKASFFLS